LVKTIINKIKGFIMFQNFVMSVVAITAK